jgi:hypothetical protein
MFIPNHFRDLSVGQEIVWSNGYSYSKHIVTKIIKLTKTTIQTEGGTKFNRSTGKLWGTSNSFGSSTRISTTRDSYGDPPRLMTSKDVDEINKAEEVKKYKSQLLSKIEKINMDYVSVEKLEEIAKILGITE